jgi:two-component system response regulator VicR
MTKLKKILICEDEEILLTALKFRLQKQGYELLLSSNGTEGKALAKTEQPDIIVTDIDLPGASGAEFVDYVRNDLHSDTPIILITPLEKGDEILDAIAKGATDFVTKPFKPVELVLRISSVFQTIEQ